LRRNPPDPAVKIYLIIIIIINNNNNNKPPPPQQHYNIICESPWGARHHHS